jgi:hypothetical protein
MLDHVPASVRSYAVPQRVLDETWQFLREVGEEGLEAVALWLGQVPEEESAEILGALTPPQIAYRGPDGLAVEVPQDVLTKLIGALPARVHILVRLHTHAGEAYHSRLDDTNMLIAHTGAISIVVPDFATGPADLRRCSVNVLGADGRWSELNRREVEARFTVT